MIIFGAQLVSTNNVVSNIFDVENTMPWLKLKAVEMKPVVSGKFIVIEVNPESEFIFVDFFLALSACAAVRFSAFNFKILPEVSDVFSHD
jgi:hypothetical protein